MKTLTIYTIDELPSVKAQEKAIDEVRCNMSLGGPAVLGYMKDRLIDAGFDGEVNVEFSLAHCQSDFVQFFGTLDLEAILRTEDLKRIHPELHYLQNLDMDFNLEIRKTRLEHDTYIMQPVVNCFTEPDCPEYTKIFDLPIQKTEALESKVQDLIANRIETIEVALVIYIENLRIELETNGYEILADQSRDEVCVAYARSKNLHFFEDGTIYQE